jgi:glycosyltransferase involved in cell wall biosynthesis
VEILHIITTFSLGGATENTLLSVEGLKSRGHDVWVIAGPSNASEGDMLERAREKGVHVETMPDLMRDIHPWKDFVAFFKLVRLLKARRVRIVHTHSSKAGILGRAAAFVAGTPIIVHTIHGLPFHEYQAKSVYTVYRWAEKVCALFSDKLVTVTDTIREKALRAGVGKASQFVTVRSGFDIEAFSQSRKDGEKLRREFGFQSSDLIIGKIARFSPLKGHRYLIDAIPRIVREVPSAKFFLVGGGELENELRHLIKSKGIERHVVFSGLVNPNRIPEVISIMDVVVHTSLLEGLARVLPQALAAQKAVVSFDIDGAREVVHDGKTGYLVPPENVDRLADAIIDLLTHRDRAVQFGLAGKALVQRQWTVEAMVQGIENVYKDLLKQRA